MFKLGKENIDKVYLGKSPVQKMYLGKTLIFPNEEAAECYAITPSIAQYDGDYPWVWAEDTEKWYRLNNYDEYEQYGIYGDSIEPDIIETTDYYNCAFNGGSYYEVVQSQTTGVNYYMKVEFTTPESITDQSFLFGTRLFIANAFAAGLFPEGDTGLVLKAHLGPTTAPITVGELQPSTKYVGEFQIVKTDTTARTATYTIYNEVGEVVYSGEKTGVLFSGTTFNMAIGTYSTGSTFPATVYLPYRGEMSRFTIKKSSTAIADNYNWEDVCDVVFTDRGGTIYPVNLYSTGVYIRSGANNTATLTDKAGQIKNIIERGESTYKGKLSIVNNIEYEWNGSKWVEIGETYDYTPVVGTNNFPKSGTYQGFTAYSADGATVRECLATYQGGAPVTIYCKITLSIASYGTNTWLEVYVNDVLQHKFQRSNQTGTSELKYTLDYKEGDVIKLRGRKQSGTGNSALAFSLGDVHYKTKEYEQKEEPENPLVFDSIEEMLSYECVYEGAVAVVGDVAYTYTNDNWGLVDYSKAIRYTTTDGKPLSNVVIGGANVMIDGTGYYIFNTVPTSIAASAFTGQTTLKTIDLPEGVTSIESAAFQNCSKLTNITLPSTLRTIGNGAFQNCSVLQNVTIPEGITTLGLSTFASCNGFTEVILPDSLTTLNRSSFAHCSNVAHIHLGKNFTTYTTYTDYGGTVNSPFVGCNAVTSVTVDDGNTTFVKDNGCSITTVSGQIKQAFPTTTYDKYTSIGDCAFLSVNFGTRAVEIPSGVTQVPQEGFRNITAQSITIPDSVVGEMNGWFRDAKIVNYFIGSGITKAFSRTWTTFDSSDTARRIEFTNAANLTTIFGNTYGLKKINYLRVPHINIDFNISFSTAFTREALLDIIDDLEEPETGAHTLTMGATNLAKLTDEDISKALSNRWILQ